MEIIVFYSWQSDLPNKTNRGFIQTALERAAKTIRNDDSIKIEPRIDKDTQGFSGSPAIPETILQKIDEAEIFVCDVSIVNRGSKFRPTPNPNVLFELGYALKTLTWDRVIMVCNEYFGKVTTLPFDLPTRRVITYSISPESEDKATERKKLEGALENQIRLIIENENLLVQKNEDETSLNPVFLEAKKLAEKQDYERFRTAWFNSGQAIKDVAESIKSIALQIRNHFSPDNDFSKVGIQLNEEKNLIYIHDGDFGCQIVIEGLEYISDNPDRLRDVQLIITLYRKLRHFGLPGPRTKSIEALTLVPDISLAKEVIWREKGVSNSIYSPEKVVEKLFEMLLNQIKEGKPLDESIPGGRYLVDGQYVDAWGHPIDEEYTSKDDEDVGSAW